MNRYYFNQRFTIGITILVVLILWYLTRINKQLNIGTTTMTTTQVPQVQDVSSAPIITPNRPPPSHPTAYGRDTDIVRDYDYAKIEDPLTEPTRRVPRHEITPHYLKSTIDIPTRGYPDNFSQQGIMVRTSSVHGKDKDKDKDININSDNQIIRLFGRQEYPGSNRYEYYVTVNSGNDQIKIPLDSKQRELFDGDIVYIKVLKDNYQVNIHRFDGPKYYPDLFVDYGTF